MAPATCRPISCSIPFGDGESGSASTTLIRGGLHGLMFTFLLVFSVDIYQPRVVGMNAQRPARGEKARRHGVVLIVVLEHAGAADRQKIVELIEPRLDHRDMALAADADDRISLVAADYET